MYVDKIKRDMTKFAEDLKSPQVVAALAQSDDEAAEDLVLGVIEQITPHIILEGISFDRPSGATVYWSHKSGGGVRSTQVVF